MSNTKWTQQTVFIYTIVYMHCTIIIIKQDMNLRGSGGQRNWNAERGRNDLNIALIYENRRKDGKETE